MLPSDSDAKEIIVDFEIPKGVSGAYATHNNSF